MRTARKWKNMPQSYKFPSTVQGSWEATNLTRKPKCWSCRALSPFHAWQPEPDEGWWNEPDYEGNNADIKINDQGEYIGEVKDVGKCGVCAEFWAIAANQKMERAGNLVANYIGSPSVNKKFSHTLTTQSLFATLESVSLSHAVIRSSHIVRRSHSHSGSP